MQQAGCLVLLLHLGELFHKDPRVLGRHLPILLPFNARQLCGGHQELSRGQQAKETSLVATDKIRHLSLKKIGDWFAWLQLSVLDNKKAPAERTGARRWGTFERYRP